MCHLVLYLSPHKHVIEVDLERPSDAYYSDHRPIRIRLLLVFVVGISFHDYTSITTKHPGTSTWYPLSVPGGHIYSPASGSISTSRSHSQLNGHGTNSCFSGPYYQGSFPSFHGSRIQDFVPHPLCT